jgi:hypothetical protein
MYPPEKGSFPFGTAKIDIFCDSAKFSDHFFRYGPANRQA